MTVHTKKVGLLRPTPSRFFREEILGGSGFAAVPVSQVATLRMSRPYAGSRLQSTLWTHAFLVMSALFSSVHMTNS